MYKYQLHLTEHQRYINNVHVRVFFKRHPPIPFIVKSVNFISINEVNEWFDNHKDEMYGMMVALE